MQQLKDLKQLVRQKKAELNSLYIHDPVAWIEEVQQERLWSKQKQILELVRNNRLTAIASCHGIGKSFTASRLMAWWGATRPPDDMFIISTAPSGPQVRAVLWRELNMAARKGHVPGVINQVTWSIDGRLVAMGRKPDDYAPDAFQGIHAEHVLVVIDEANGIPKSLWMAALSLATSSESRVVAIGNPDNPMSFFAEVSKPGSGWATMNIGYADTPNFTGEEVDPKLADVLISPQWVEEMGQMVGEESPIYVSKVLGQFPSQVTDALISLQVLQRKSIIAPSEPVVMAIDVARYGTDRTVFGLRQGDYYRTLLNTTQEDTMRTVSRARELYEIHKPKLIAVDANGLGAGVYDRLLELDYPVLPMMAGERARNNKRFANKRAEWFWGLRERFIDGIVDIDLEDHSLVSELATIRTVANASGRIQIESKEDMKKRGLRSPDFADAMAMAFASASADTWEDVYGDTPEGEDSASDYNPWLGS